MDAKLVGEPPTIQEVTLALDKQQEYERLFRRYSLPVRTFFARRGFDIEDCRELTQETFLGVYKGMDRFRRDSPVESWLFAIAANIWRNQLRKLSAEKRDREFTSLEVVLDEVENSDESKTKSDSLAFVSDVDPLESLLDEERRMRVREALSELPPQMRHCLILRIDRQLKYREIAEIMQISIETVKSQLFQARERLQDMLETT